MDPFSITAILSSIMKGAQQVKQWRDADQSPWKIGQPSGGERVARIWSSMTGLDALGQLGVGEGKQNMPPIPQPGQGIPGRVQAPPMLPWGDDEVRRRMIQWGAR